MRKRIKRLIKGLLKTGSLFVLIGIGVTIGVIIGVNTADRGETIIIRGNGFSQIEDELAPVIEQRIKEQVVQRVEERIQEQIVISSNPANPPIPEVPPIPPIPTNPPNPPNLPPTIYVNHSLSFVQVVNIVGTILASLGLIGLGVVIIVRGRRALKEKTPESLNK